VQRRDSPGRSQLAGREATLGLGVQRLVCRFFCNGFRRYADFVGCSGWMRSMLLVSGRDLLPCAVG
jgi:hypothetical protein